MKHFILIVLIASIFTACGNNKKSNEFSGSYSNDTITFIFKNKGICDVITAVQTMKNCDYSLDVDMKNICVVDANQNIYLFEIKEDCIISNTGSTLKKIK
jgi:alanine-alpha-ketoisovalerate/valine-pyruvate aminotransferase